ncbi:MAG TPA: hypothetical protein VMU57_14555, partial [Edaphobacter sp.]|uniref:hypothetical protein n=1 Tax=Edaphobacter sp. TaxID=1934404 RepID=UPI002BE74763
VDHLPLSLERRGKTTQRPDSRPDPALPLHQIAISAYLDFGYLHHGLLWQSHAESAYRKLRSQQPKLQIAIGPWNCTGRAESRPRDQSRQTGSYLDNPGAGSGAGPRHRAGNRSG